jgi:hypothetical protein
MVDAITEINVSELGVLDGGSFIFEIPKEQKDFYIQNISTMMKDNEYNGTIGIIGDSKTSIAAKQVLFQGQGNASNLGWQLEDDNVVFMSTSREIFAGSNQAALAFPFELVGIIPWIPMQNRKPVDINMAWNGNLGDYGQITVPVMDKEGNVAYELPLAISHYATRSNTSARNGSKQDDLLQVEVSLDLSATFAPLSARRGANDTVIYGVDLEPLTV